MVEEVEKQGWMSPVDLAWAAGLFEGEGSVRINSPTQRGQEEEVMTEKLEYVIRSLGTRNGQEWWEALVTVPKENQGLSVDAPSFVDAFTQRIADETGIRVLRLGWKDDTHLWVQGPKKAESKP